MIELPKVKKWSSKKEGWADNPIILTQVDRNERVALYSRHHEGCPIRGYEVFLIRTVKKGTPICGGGVEKDDREVYPRAAAFGFTAWSVGDLERAKRKFQELTDSGIAADAIKEEEAADGTDIIEEEGLTWPEIKFSCTDVAEKYNISYTDAYIAIKKAIKEKVLKLGGKERRSAKGKETQLFERDSENQEILVESPIKET